MPDYGRQFILVEAKQMRLNKTKMISVLIIGLFIGTFLPNIPTKIIGAKESNFGINISENHLENELNFKDDSVDKETVVRNNMGVENRIGYYCQPMADNFTSAPYSTTYYPFRVYDNFDMGEEVEVDTITFYGVAVWGDDSFDGMPFLIGFFNDDCNGSPDPNSVISEQSWTATAADQEFVQTLWYNYTIWLVTVELPIPVTVTSGWFSVQSNDTSNDTYIEDFAWIPGVGGDGYAEQWLYNGSSIIYEDYDMAFCLSNVNENDTVYEPILTEGFENGFTPVGWTNTGWMDSYYGFPHSGSHWAYSWGAGDTLTTPLLSFGDNTELSFWYTAESQNHPMSLQVKLDNSIVVWSRFNFNHTCYQKAVVDLSAYSGYHKISFIGLTSDMYGQLLDDISVYNRIPNPVYVDDDYTSSTPGWQYNHFDVIQDGVDAVAEGGTVYVYNGMYYENVNVYKTVDLIGENRDSTIIDGGGIGDVVYVSADWVNMSRFNVINSGGTYWYDAGIDIHSDFNTFTDNNVSYNCEGIHLEYSNNNTIIGNNAYSNLFNESRSICLVYSNDNIVANNNIFNNSEGIRISDSNNNIITCNNVFNNHLPGIILWSSSDNIITGNNLSTNHIGIMLISSYNNTVSSNNASNNNGSGIYLASTSSTTFNNTITGNNASNNSDGGITLIDAAVNTITSNKVSYNNYSGIQLFSSNMNTITGNNASNNNDDGIYISSSNCNTVTGNIAKSNNDNGISILYSSNNNIVTDNQVSNCYTGIHIISSNYNTFTGNDASNNNYGIKLEAGSNTNTITDNKASYNWFGIYLYSSNANTITCNNASNNDDGGIYISSSNAIAITDNKASCNLFGIRLYSSNTNTITGNNVSNNGDDGIFLSSSNTNTITSNTANSNTNHGIYLLYSIYNTVISNTANSNNYGIYIGSSSYNTIYNNFFSSINNFYDDGNNVWNISKTPGTNIIGGPYLGGNYWSDYTGADTDGDGLGNTDIPYGPGDYLPLTNHTIQLDVNQSIFNRGFPVRHAIDGDWAGAQNFTPTIETVTTVDIYLRKMGAPEFDLTVELREDGPQGTLLDTVVIPIASVPTSWTWLTIDFADTTVGAGSNVFIVLPPAPSGVTTSYGYEWGYALGNQYDGGAFFFTRNGGVLWRDLPTMYEFCFRTYGYS